jgi:hypothetical protein
MSKGSRELFESAAYHAPSTGIAFEARSVKMAGDLPSFPSSISASLYAENLPARRKNLTMNLKNDCRVLLSAVIGGLLGYFVFFWLTRQGFYALVLPGGLLGIGAGIFKNRSKYIAVICSILALTLGFFTEWRFAPFAADASLSYFVSHVHQLRPLTLIMIGVGAFLAFWIPFRSAQEAKKAA